ncbi:ABC transporter substrate-binding protein [Microlunatus ginsengisoli]|uniref:Fe/B12 periplasmic-binding domain-containing protein n=1 Tax=Microlunatus ginsengisoli TaxID=363863 RepID=A0ABP6ZN73_9ACTN
MNAGMERADYDKLSKIAPTVTSITGARRYFSAWQDQTRQIATAVGKPAEGEKLIAEIRAGFATLAGAIYFTTPLSLAYVLEHLTPQLALATKGQAPREYPAG